MLRNLMLARMIGTLPYYAQAPGGAEGATPAAEVKIATGGEAKPAAAAGDAKPTPGADGKPVATATGDGKAAIGADGKPVAASAATPAWPETWRDQMAGGDAKAGTVLARFADPAALAKAYLELSNRVAAGELKAPVKPPAADATPEVKAAWRKDQGLPDAPAGYVDQVKIGNGIVLPDAEKNSPAMQSIAKAAFENNVSPEQFNFFVGQYYALRDAETAATHAKDTTFERTALTELGQAWGKDAPANLQTLSTFTRNVFGEQFLQQLHDARLPNGDKLMNTPHFAKAWLGLALKVDPALPHLPNGAGAGGVDATARLAELRKMAGSAPNSTDYAKYWLGPSGIAHQKEYRDLLVATGKAPRQQA